MRLSRAGIQCIQNAANTVASRFIKKAPQIDAKIFGDVFSVTNCALSGLINKTASAAQSQNPKLFENVNGLLLAKNDTIPRRLFEAGRDFLEIPFDILSEIASKFPNSKLNKSQFLQNHRAHILAENELAALQGVRGIMSDFAKDFAKNGVKTASAPIDGKCIPDCEGICDKISGKINGLLNETMEFGNSTFDTKKERFTTRIVSGFLPAFCLGADYFNKAKLKGKTDKEALEAQHGKQFQEIKETTEEGIMQYLLNACFGEFLNSNVTAGAISGLIIGTISRIHSRVSKGRPVFRVNTPENSMAEFVRAAQTGTAYRTQSEIEKESKEPVLSKKNLVKGFAILVAAAYALRFASNTKVAQKFLEPIKNKMTQFELSNMEDVIASKADIDKFKDVLAQCNEGKYAEWIGRAVDGAFNKGATEINLGSRYKTVKLLGLFEVKQIKLKTAILMPFKFAKEVASYPYKLASKLEAPVKRGIEGVINLVRKMQGNNTKFAFQGQTKPKSLVKDNYNFKNVYLKYKEFDKKFGSDPAKMQEEFGKYLHEMRIASLNRKTSSKVDNTAAAAISQITGSLAGIWFNMNDDYNAAIKNGENRVEAKKAARLRGINKIVRTTSQAAIWDTLMGIFGKQYGGSLTGSMIMVAISSILTDKTSRFLTAMPTKKMKTKEDIEIYQQNKKDKFIESSIDKAIDRLAS